MNHIVKPNNGDALSEWVGFLQRAASDPNIDVAKLRELMAMLERERDRQGWVAFNRAMAAVAAEIQQIIPTGKNPTFSSPYASLEDLDREARPIYARHGISIRYGSGYTRPNAISPPQPGWQRVVIILSHGDYTEEHHLDAPPSVGSGRRTPMQEVGSNTTYARRYLLQMALNLVTSANPDDDDGEASRNPIPSRRPPPPPPPAREAPPKRRTVNEWLTALEIQLQDAQSSEDVDHILAGREVQEAQLKLTNGAKDRLDTMIREALDRFRSDDITPEDRLGA